MTSYAFLSPEWISAARDLRVEYADQMPDSPVETRINVVVTDIAHRDDGTLEGHIDTSQGQTLIEEGHVEDPELTVTVDYDTAKAAFVTRDQQAVMEAFLTGKILVEGDASKLLALQGGTQEVSPAVAELYKKLDALTAKDA